MGVLKDLTEEYFGNKVRKEDVSFRYDIDNETPPEHTLTPEEEAFLQGLAKYKLFLDKSLYFQIEDLQRHTKLVLSRNDGRYIRPEFPDKAKLEREIAELEKMIQDVSDKLERKELPEEYFGMLNVWKRQYKKLNEALDNPVDSTSSTPYLGLYYNNGRDSKVVLFLDSIEEAAKKIPCKPKFLMGQVLLHEYFHSFYFHVGTGMRNPMKCMEEPMAEYGSLVALDSVASSGASVAAEAGEALRHTLGFVKDKQKCTGLTAAYGFGAYLFEEHKDDAFGLIAQYAIMSCLMDNRCKDALEYKYLLYPEYPSYLWAEDAAYKKLGELLKVVVVREPNAIRFVRKVFEFLKDNDLLDSLEPYVHAQETKNPRKSFALSQDGCFCLRSVLFDDSTPPPAISSGPFVIGGNAYHLWLSPDWSEKFKTSRYPRPIDEFIKMIKHVYHGQFDIRKTGDEYVMSYEIK